MKATRLLCRDNKVGIVAIVSKFVCIHLSSELAKTFDIFVPDHILQAVDQKLGAFALRKCFTYAAKDIVGALRQV